MGNTTAPSGTGAAATGAASGAATGAAAAGAQVLESVAQAQARKRLERMWQSSKSSSLAFRARVRGSKTALPYNNLILWVVSLLRVGDLAYTYAEWHKTSITSLPVFVSVLRKNYPHLHATIIKALELRGEPCRNAVEDACDTLFGHFSGQLHSAFIYGVVLYCLLDSESPRQDELRQMLHRYLYKQASELPAFEDSCRHPEAATLTSAELQAEYSEAQLVALPGYRRLSPDANDLGFEDQWALLLDAATAVLAQMALPETSDAALSLIGSKFADQATGETVAQFFVRLKRAYTDCRSALDRLGCRRLLPHPDTLVPLVFQRTRVEYSAEVRGMLRLSKLTEADLTIDLVCSLYSQAAARVVKTLPALDADIA